MPIKTGEFASLEKPEISATPRKADTLKGLVVSRLLPHCPAARSAGCLCLCVCVCLMHMHHMPRVKQRQPMLNIDFHKPASGRGI
ncbi:hypothetical protein FF011L_26590 [Roseimaritima multifibrata]|uniref:Uncharacterized protein n=1 Tax=Roseimaritima multifibrata TaxID=1930274 RepID=A0A517MG71_9BACT|nr:hypothetical protein FF011L_26590 [Roseimaritima multifibrata]